jgi:hypothetical protein
VRWNGSNRATTFVSSTQLQASISAGDVATAGTAQVSVSTPSPGGGTSGALPFTVAPPATITVSSINVSTGGTVTATLSNGLGGASDWLALASTSAPNTSYIQYIFLGAGVTSRAWTVTMPSTPGTYEFRLFPNNGYVRAATSPTVTVAVGPNPVPVITSTAPSSAIVASGAFTLAVQGSGFVSTSVARWNGSNRSTTYISSTEVRAAITAEDVAVAGTAQLSVFSPAPGGGTSTAVPFTIAASSTTLAVSSTNVAPGQTISVTLTNGYGGSTDWLALAATSAPNGSYISYMYVGAGVTTNTWSVTMPSTPGTYEFRLFLNNGYVRAATSPTITVAAGGGGGGGGGGAGPQLAVSATSAAPGSQVTVTLSGGYGGATDWIALASTTAPDTNYLQYVYVGSGVTTRTWTVTLPTTPGTYEFRLFLNNGYTRAATSPTVVVGSQ